MDSEVMASNPTQSTHFDLHYFCARDVLCMQALRRRLIHRLLESYRTWATLASRIRREGEGASERLADRHADGQTDRQLET